MKFDFDTFEFTGLIAPGSILLLAILFLHPELLRAGDAAVVIALAVLASYVLGHLIAAVGNLIEPGLRRFEIYDLESMECDEWEERNYLAEDQRARFYNLIKSRLYRTFDPSVPGAFDQERRSTVVKQMYLKVIESADQQRVKTFNGLFNLSRGLAVSLGLSAFIGIAVQHYAVAAICVLGVALALYRARKFKNRYNSDLLQQFLLLDETPPPVRPTGQVES